MSPFNEEGTVSVLEIDRATMGNAGLTTIVVDIWDGDRTDPTVGVKRYMGAFTHDDFEKIKLRKRWGDDYEVMKADEVGCVLWEYVVEVKKVDRDAESMMNDEKSILSDNWSHRGKKDVYERFLDAIDVLAKDDTDKEAWAAVDAWRGLYANLHEK